MARYIDADELLKSMQRRYDEICDTYGYHDLYASGYDDAVDAVENAPTADVAPRAEWISVEERLPERELQELMCMNPLKVFPCLAVIESDCYNIAYVSQDYYAEEGFISGDSGLITEKITHWMPLPEPPKGE